MKRALTCVSILTVLALAAACGGADRAEAPAEPERTGPSTAQTPPETTAEDDAAATGEGPDEGQEAAAQPDGSEEEAGESIQTLSGERVSIGGGEVTALYFMAGW